jgi:hypothetical protein
MNGKILYINILMDQLNDLMIELYEEMADEEDKKVVKICEKIQDIIRQIKSDHSEEV